MVTLAGHLADVLADADRMAAGSSAAAAGSSAASAAGPTAAGVAADGLPAGPAGGGASPSTEAEGQAAWRAYTAGVQPDLGELVRTAADGAVVAAGWAAGVLERVQCGGPGVSVFSTRLEKT